MSTYSNSYHPFASCVLWSVYKNERVVKTHNRDIHTRIRSSPAWSRATAPIRRSVYQARDRWEYRRSFGDTLFESLFDSQSQTSKFGNTTASPPAHSPTRRHPTALLPCSNRCHHRHLTAVNDATLLCVQRRPPLILLLSPYDAPLTGHAMYIRCGCFHPPPSFAILDRFLRHITGINLRQPSTSAIIDC